MGALETSSNVGFTDMLYIANLDMQETCKADIIGDCLVTAVWAICSSYYHMVLKVLSGVAAFGRDILFDILYLADRTTIKPRLHVSVD